MLPHPLQNRHGKLALSKYCSMKWFFLSESNNINLYEIIIFCCLKYIFECRNGFNMLENP
jgi:hypothetical protein